MASYSRLDGPKTSDEKGFLSSDDGDLGEAEAFLRQSLSLESPGEVRWPDDVKLPGAKLNWFSRHWRAVVIHLALLCVNLGIVAFFATMGHFGRPWSLDPVWASNPISPFIQFEPRKFELLAIYAHDGRVNPHKPNAFNGPPRPELEAEWDDFMKHSEVRVSKEELGEYADDDSIIKLTDGSGYYVTISAFHGLHCVRRLHQYLFADHYYHNLTEFETFLLLRHTEHCLDWLRQYIQCHADPTLIPIHWTTNDAFPVSKDIGNRQCVAWEPFEEWMAEHSFDPYEPGLLVHPVFGAPQTTDPGRTKPVLGAHELGHGGLFHADGHHGNGTFE